MKLWLNPSNFIFKMTNCLISPFFFLSFFLFFFLGSFLHSCYHFERNSWTEAKTVTTDLCDDHMKIESGSHVITNFCRSDMSFYKWYKFKINIFFKFLLGSNNQFELFHIDSREREEPSLIRFSNRSSYTKARFH